MSKGQVNPLGLIVRPGIQEMPLDSIRTGNIALNNRIFSKETTTTLVKNNTDYYRNRIRREQNYVVGSETYIENGKHLEIVKMVSYKLICVLCLFILKKNHLFCRTVWWETPSV